MPVKYRIDKLVVIVYAEARGRLTDVEALGYQRDVKADPRFNPAYREFLDCSEVRVFEVTPQGLRILASGSPWKDGAKRAFVAHADHAFGMLRMYQSLLDPRVQEVAVFRTASEARRWLELDEEVPRSVGGGGPGAA